MFVRQTLAPASAGPVGPVQPAAERVTLRPGGEEAARAQRVLEALNPVTLPVLAAMLEEFKLPHVRDGLANVLDAHELLQLVEEAMVMEHADEQAGRSIESLLLGALKPHARRIDAARLHSLAETSMQMGALRICHRLLEIAPREHQRTHELSSSLARHLVTQPAPRHRVLGLQVVERLSSDLIWADAINLALQHDADPLVVAAAKKMLASQPDSARDASIVLVQRLMEHRSSVIDASKAARALGVQAAFPGLAEQGREEFLASLVDMPAKAMGYCTLNPSLRLHVAAAAIKANKHLLALQLCTEPGDEHRLKHEHNVIGDREKAAMELQAIQRSAMQLNGARVSWVDTKAFLVRGVSDLERESGPVALDCEWKPVPDGSTSPAEIIQLARGQVVLVIDVRQSALVRENNGREMDMLLTEFFSSVQRVYGFGMETDCTALCRSLPHMQCWKTLRTCKANVPCGKGESLKTVAKRTLSLTVDKTQQMSDWARRPLLPEQLTYAAVDALAIVRIMHALHGAAAPLSPPLSMNIRDARNVSSDLGNRMLFFCDERLRRLAKMLRAIGCDTLWEGPSGFGEGGRRQALQARMDRARSSSRVFVSDDPLVENMEGVCFVGAVDDLADRFRLVVHRYRLRTDVELLTRCTMCNGPNFVRVSKEEAKALQPSVVTNVVLAKVDEFFSCPSCGIVVWQGPKFDRLHAQIKAVIKACEEGMPRKAESASEV